MLSLLVRRSRAAPARGVRLLSSRANPPSLSRFGRQSAEYVPPEETERLAPERFFRQTSAHRLSTTALRLPGRPGSPTARLSRRRSNRGKEEQVRV